eukprot:CAMPEP_0168492450 /NCGR_PEP_ID=MMETSP0228-20121227/70216_1 /TAXON_ID=133427 /ORGANISM="Protoceratium reticulatum, Strain CCCM 535 (=CCMP 1889)" /LENGTH=328 /DNA_ID=CAMNT_0008509215 /DNA_START=1 /DNA_END=987 /DNA_ORIENTATION=-
MKATRSTSALKTAATISLKGPEQKTVALTKDAVTMKVPPGAPGDTTTMGWNTTHRMSEPVRTIWEDASDVKELPATGQSRQVSSLSEKVSRMGSIFEEESRARSSQRHIVKELHEDQMKRIDEIGTEIDGSIAELASHMENFVSSSRQLLKDSYDGLHGNLRGRVDKLIPRLRELETRAHAVQTGLEEERQARLRETSEVLLPIKVQIERLEKDLDRERKVRENRDVEIKQQMEQAVAALDGALDTETAARKQRVDAAIKECEEDHKLLLKRQDKMEHGLEEVKDELLKEMDLEQEQRIGAQDPVVEALTSFIQKFQKNIKEQSLLGH